MLLLLQVPVDNVRDVFTCDLGVIMNLTVQYICDS